MSECEASQRWLWNDSEVSCNHHASKCSSTDIYIISTATAANTSLRIRRPNVQHVRVDRLLSRVTPPNVFAYCVRKHGQACNANTEDEETWSESGSDSLLCNPTSHESLLILMHLISSVCNTLQSGKWKSHQVGVWDVSHQLQEWVAGQRAVQQVQTLNSSSHTATGDKWGPIGRECELCDTHTHTCRSAGLLL